MPTIADQTITSGTLREFERGDWLADISTNSGTLIPNGTRVDIVAETVRRSGAIIRGGISGDVGRYLVSGRPEWDVPLPARPRNAYRSSASVLLRNVLGDILLDVFGPSWPSLVVLPSVARLDEHYERPGTKNGVTYTGRDLLELLGLPWYVRADGITVFAERVGGLVSPSDTPLVPYRNDALGLRTIMSEDPGAFVPGKSFEGEIIGEVTFSIQPEDITIYTWPRKTSGIFAGAVSATIRRLFPRLFFQGIYEYVVAGPASNGRHGLKSVGSRWLPDVQLASFWTGAAGHTASLAAGTRVGLAFMDCDPAKPVLVCVKPGMLPESTEFVAVTSIAIDAASVDLGAALLSPARYTEIVDLIPVSPPGAPPTFTFILVRSPTNIVPPTRVKA